MTASSSGRLAPKLESFWPWQLLFASALRRPVEFTDDAIGVNDEAVLASAPARRHAERVVDEHRRLGRVDRPADDEPGEGVENDAAVELALAGRVLGDVGHPELVGPVAAELAPNEIERGDGADPGTLGHSPCW